MTQRSAPVALVLGARGTLGAALVSELPRAGWRLGAALDRDACDIRDFDRVRAAVADARVDAVFNAAAYTNVDRAESEPDVAFAVNALGAETVARAAAEAGAAVVHYSTDFVFDGAADRPYDELDPPSPRGTYARSKAFGDRLVAAAAPRHFILRVGGLFGRGGRNFPSTVVRRLRAGETVRAERGRLCSPTWAAEVAAVSAAIAAAPHPGLYHCTSQGETSWEGFARAAAAQLGLPAERVEGVPTAALPFKAPRPRRAVLENRMLRLRGLDRLSRWEDALAAFIASETGSDPG
jgi:dTDP-4-dehydrorhamnose reductase